MKSTLKTVLLILMISCLPILSSCSNRPPTTTYVYEKLLIEPEVFEVGCGEVGAGESVRTLAHGFVINRSCLRAYKELVDGLKRMYTKEGALDDTRKPNTSNSGSK